MNYWRECYSTLSQRDDSKVAYAMVGVLNNDNFDSWYEGTDDRCQIFAQIFDLAAELETPLVSGEVREKKWREVALLLDMPGS